MSDTATPAAASGRDPFRLDGRLAVVIGAASGLGEATARSLAERGARVQCWDRDGAGAAELASQLEGAAAREVDVLDRESLRSAFAALPGELPLAGVASTPGVNVRKPLLDYTSDEFEKVVQLNLRGAFHVLQEAGGALNEAGGSIVLFSSIRSQVVEPGQGVYAATKAGIVQLVRTAAAELGPRRVRVNAVAPGVIDTPLTQPIKDVPSWFEAYRDKTALCRWGRPEEIGRSVAFLLSDASSYMTGSVLFVDGGWTAIDGRFTPPGMTD